MNNLKMNMSEPSDSRLEYLTSNWLSEKDANNDIRMMFEENDNLCSEEIALGLFGILGKDVLLDLPRTKNSTSISLTKPQVRMILDIIDYYHFNYWYGDRAIANSMNIQGTSPLIFLWCFIDCPEQWDTEDFEDWKRKEQATSFVEHSASFAGTATTTITAPKIISNEEVVSGNSAEKGTNDVVDDDNINNVKSPPECENSIGDLDGIQDEYYQEKENNIDDDFDKDGSSNLIVVDTDDDSSSNSTEDVAAAVMKEDEDSRDELDLYQEEIEWLNSTFTTISSENILELIADAVDSYDNIILYYEFLRSDQGTIVLAENPENWVKDDFDYWIDNDCHPTVASANAASSGTTANATWRHMLNMMLKMRNHDSNTEAYTEYISNEKVNSNLNDTVDDDIDNAKSPPECENSIGDLNGIKNDYYQVEGKYGSIYDRSDDDNPPPLPPEPPANAIDIQCIHSNIPNNGEILSLPLFSSVYRVKQSDQMENDGLHDSPKAITDFPTHDNSSQGFWDDADDDEIDSNAVNSTVSSNRESTVGAHDCYNNYDVDLDATQQEGGKYSIRNLDAPHILNVKSQVERGNPNEDLNGIQLCSIDVNSNLSVAAAADNEDDVIVLEMIEEVNEEYLFWRPHRLVSNEEVTLNESRTEIVSNENVVISNLNVAAAAATDDDDDIHSRDEEHPDEEEHHEELIGVLDGTRQDILNVKSENYDDNYDGPSAKYQSSTAITTTTTNPIEDLAGIQQEYSPGEYNNLDEYVNAYNSTTDKTKLIILETHQVNNNDDDILNADSNNLKAKLAFEGDSIGNKDEIYGAQRHVIYDRTDDPNPPPLPPESNNHNHDLENCYDDHYRVHSELIDSNPSMIPNDGEKVVLFSSVSRAEMVKNEVMSGSVSRVEMVKNEVMSGRLFQSVYRVNSNINLNKILQIVLSIFLQLGCEWTLKKYRVDNDSKMDWILKWYRADNDDELEWLMKRYTVDNDDDGCNNEPASGYDSRIRGIPTVTVAAELNADEIDDLVYHDSNNDDDNEDNGDTFHDSIQVEDMIEYRKPINNAINAIDYGEQRLTPINNAINAIDYGEQRLTLYIFNYAVSAKLEWSLKKCRVDNIKFDQKKELKRCDHTDATKEDQGYSMPDLLDHLDSISSKQDPYSNFKEEMKSNRMLSSPMEKKDGECPDPEVKLYYRGAHRQRYLGKPLGEMDYVWGDNESMSNSPTVPEAKLHKRHSILSFHYVISMISRGFINLQHLASEWYFADMLTKNRSYQSSYYKLIQPLFHHSGNTAALFLDDTLEVDVSIAEGSIFGILGSEKLSNYCYVLAVKQSEKPMNGMHVCGQDIVETSIYYSKKTTTGTIRIVRYSKRYVYYGKKTTTGTVGIVP